ncbi:sigma-54-dependent transcriptional regulator [Desulforhopalus singaporensis]|uniref:Response regulator receiver domain-containing protein n=1 Tax=Desulforhopalus singaporensis TaxID=91360 RepID=A0A1H0SXS5_9BACT|nr:response regulator [Desulforhopalus singaporensis]SDP46381.1 Response regulator receiver domain-containing protein [Desulforhopalus singaporensis]
MSEQLKARVLLVDDEQDFLKMLSDRLKMRGLKVNTVSSGEEAVSKVEEQDYDAVILDLSMPGIDGLETIRQIKTKNPDAEIIMLTGHGSIKSSVEALKLGATDYLQKPVDIKELLGKIGEAHDKRMLIVEKKSQQALEEILKSRGW